MGGIADGRRFHAGIFVGVNRRTGQNMLYDGDSIKLAQTVLRMPGAEKWNKEAMAKIGCTPYDLHQPCETKRGEQGGATEEGRHGPTGLHQACGH